MPPVIENPDDVHGYCTECGTEQPDKYMESSPFNVPPCKFCGAPTFIAHAEYVRQAKENIDRGRNIGHDPTIKYGE
jgi:hypothetical protein